MIVVGGEALIDLVPADPGGAPGPLAPLRPLRGGGPYNTALALARLGTATSFCSRVSTDAFGEALLAGLRADGVNLSLVQRGPEPTTLAVATVGADGSAEYGFYVEGTADRLFEEPAVMPDAAKALCLGTCSLVLEPGATAYEALLRWAAHHRVFTLLDPNIRPALIASPAAYRARFRSWLADVPLLKLSEADAAWLADGQDVPRAAEGWLAAGPAAVVMTHGAEGLSVLARGGRPAGEGALRCTVAAPAVRVVDTIGAGDTVNAALLHWLEQRGALSRPAVAALDAAAWHEGLTYAARAAALTCTRAGAEPPYAGEL
ncbi:2-dehydro-3-deoxygluconokinase [Streptomyces sp. RB5]|uniref:2-dehydro-3-deoxygluconokinase n=1 Tax=Streptomyces smaragdinus TaxID=2585196 RepID=A0A7K0CG82_9ACTN|nr:carbohydrate kinase [Streptomyces smaragdinus]MQY12406.1 2-dehydro-3-deoxygluconokinase [Streptomyces smaragdinus]